MVICWEDYCASNDDMHIVIEEVMNSLAKWLPKDFQIEKMKNAMHDHHAVFWFRKPNVWSSRFNFYGIRGSNGRIMGGITRPHKNFIEIIVAVQNRKCIVNSSFVHELVHFFSWIVKMDLQINHDNDIMWNEALEEAKDKSMKRICNGHHERI